MFFRRYLTPMIDNAYFINLDRRIDRMQKFMSHFRSSIFHPRRESATDASLLSDLDVYQLVTPGAYTVIKMGRRTDHSQMTRGAVGCSMSHIGLWRKLVAMTRFDRMLILEDDGIPIENFDAAIRDMFSKLPDKDWDILLLGALPTFKEPEAIIRSRGWGEVKRFYGTHAYIIKASAARVLLANATPLNVQIDSYMFQEGGRKGLKIVAFPEQLVNQNDRFTDIQTSPCMGCGSLIG